MKIFSGNVRAAYKTLKRNRGRSFLTMLGIIIAVSSVITVVSIGEGVKRQVSKQVQHVGVNVLTIRPGQADASIQGLVAGGRSSGDLPDKDVAIIQKVHGVDMVVPMAVVSGSVKADHGEYHGVVVGTGKDLPTAMNQTVGYGGFFSDDDERQHVAVLGEDAAAAMFDDQVPLGRTFKFRGQEFMVRGILNRTMSVPLSNEVDLNKAVIIPYSTANELTGGSARIYEIFARVAKKDAATVTATSETVRKDLLKAHGDEHDFAVLKSDDVQAATHDVLQLVTQLIIGAAAVCMFVGGVGIMNITLVSVTERMREIGIKKAVGATSRQILNEFLAEAIVLSVVGAVFGIIAAGIINVLLHLLTDLAPVMQWQVVVVATVVSMLVGILFGSAPAFKAARKDPITALRNE